MQTAEMGLFLGVSREHRPSVEGMGYPLNGDAVDLAVKEIYLNARSAVNDALRNLKFENAHLEGAVFGWGAPIESQSYRDGAGFAYSVVDYVAEHFGEKLPTLNPGEARVFSNALMKRINGGASLDAEFMNGLGHAITEQDKAFGGAMTQIGQFNTDPSNFTRGYTAVYIPLRRAMTGSPK